MNILAINPWIYDFAAYDFWLKPYGFLSLLTYLKNKGVFIDYIDCLEEKITQDDLGRGKYASETIAKPAALSRIPRRFKRYGISVTALQNQLKEKNYDYILITSSMTYWYPAVIDLVKILKGKYPRTPMVLGGTYATLCGEHAKNNSGCDFIFPHHGLADFFQLLNLDFDRNRLLSTLPAYEDFYPPLNYVALRTSWGCPFRCSYCAIGKLSKGFFRIKQDKVISFILKYHSRGIRNFALYDDAFLYQTDYAKALLQEIAALKLKAFFHTPNALHLKFVDKETARLLKQAGFFNPHFGVETTQPRLQKSWGNKVNKQEIINAITRLNDAGFGPGEFSVYMLLGYPGQDLVEFRNEALFLHSLGARISLAEFSPVPGTRMFSDSTPDLDEPLRHNNSIFPSCPEEKIKDFWETKNYVQELNKTALLSGQQPLPPTDFSFF